MLDKSTRAFLGLCKGEWMVELDMARIPPSDHSSTLQNGALSLKRRPFLLRVVSVSFVCTHIHMCTHTSIEWLLCIDASRSRHLLIVFLNEHRNPLL